MKTFTGFSPVAHFAEGGVGGSGGRGAGGGGGGFGGPGGGFGPGGVGGVGGAGGGGPGLTLGGMQAALERELFWQPPATCFAVLNQHVVASYTPAAQPGRLVQSAQQSACVAAGSLAREPLP